MLESFLFNLRNTHKLTRCFIPLGLMFVAWPLGQLTPQYTYVNRYFIPVTVLTQINSYRLPTVVIPVYFVFLVYARVRVKGRVGLAANMNSFKCVVMAVMPAIIASSNSRAAKKKS